MATAPEDDEGRGAVRHLDCEVQSKVHFGPFLARHARAIFLKARSWDVAKAL